ncbi:hypothetical protein MKX01_029738 [Papaver californicum]|nr:hypothetical protein MKX01_029738 [Papaver californicum]
MNLIHPPSPSLSENISMAAAARTSSQILIQSKKLSILSASTSASTSSRFVTQEIDRVNRKEEEISTRLVTFFTWFFLLGTSVPLKKRPRGFAELIGKLANPLYEDETLSLTNARGWPSTSFFIDDMLQEYIPSNKMVSEESSHSSDLKSSSQQLSRERVK